KYTKGLLADNNWFIDLYVLKFNLSNEHSLNFTQLGFKSGILVDNTGHTEAGKYHSSIKIIDNNYSFSDGKNEMHYSWEILPKNISDNSIVDNANLKFDSDVLY
ncbi:hypothetical protein, partial [Mycoplasmopsis bovis]|uniref:hypothetical protein n=1 Tax=Mycoplasmopsis bovis TaxID=28903 RepID=UPI003D2AC7F2